MNDDYQSFEEVKGRLDDIVEAVSSENISLDDAITLYEEAVNLGLLACNLSEIDFSEEEISEAEEELKPEFGDETGKPSEEELDSEIEADAAELTTASEE